MPPFLRFKFTRPTTAQAVLLAMVLLATSVDGTRLVTVAGVSGLGLLSLAAVGVIWAIWMLRPVLPPRLLVTLLPLMFFVLDAIGTLLWYRPGSDGIQLLVVANAFLGIIMVTAREVFATPALARQLRLAMLALSALPVAVWLVLLLAKVLPPEYDNASRGFALYAMVICAIGLATWRDYSWPERRRGDAWPKQRSSWSGFIPLGYVVLVAFVVLLGGSRTALVAIAMLVPLSLIYRGNVKSIAMGLVMSAIGGGIFAAVLFNYQPLYDRFFKEDAVKVGGVSINATGRTKIWGMLINSIGDDWIFGKGVSSSEDAVNQSFRNIGQPHNDYIRFYYDQGVLGLGLWLIFITFFVSRTVGNLRRSIRNRSPDYAQHLSVLLALTAVSFSMLTDNSYCYAFVMFPLGILMGGSLGLGQYHFELELASRPAEDSPFFQSMAVGRQTAH